MKGIFAILAAMLLAIMIMVGNLFLTMDHTDEEETAGTDFEYHVQIIMQNTDEHFWTLFQQGAKDAGNEDKVYVEFVRIAPRDIEELTETVERAVYSKVDGIALQAADIKNTKMASDMAMKQGIPVVSYENDKYQIPNVPTVGSNSYDIGYTAGKLIPEAVDEKANAAVILEDGNSQEDKQYKNMKIQGMLDAVSVYSGINLVDVYTLDSGMFEAEKLTYSIIEENKDINVIICTDEKSTPGVAQVLVENDKVGDIKLIGYGTMSQTLDYIKRGVIYGTVAPDAYEIGYQTVEQLHARIKGETASDSENTGLFTIDKNNIDEFEISH